MSFSFSLISCCNHTQQQQQQQQQEILTRTGGSSLRSCSERAIHKLQISKSDTAPAQPKCAAAFRSERTFCCFLSFHVLTHTNILIYIYMCIFLNIPTNSPRSHSLFLSLALALSRAAFLQLIHLSAAWKICTGIALRSASAMMNRSVSLNLHVFMYS